MISADELMSVLNENFGEISQEEVDELVASADLDGNGEIDYQEV